MKRPKWTDETPTYVCHPAATLKHVAKVLRIDAADARRMGLKNVPATLLYAAQRLEFVASGKTWAEAFGWPSIDAKGKK